MLINYQISSFLGGGVHRFCSIIELQTPLFSTNQSTNPFIENYSFFSPPFPSPFFVLATRTAGVAISVYIYIQPQSSIEYNNVQPIRAIIETYCENIFIGLHTNVEGCYHFVYITKEKKSLFM
jgi:hypothetical protein